MMSVSNRARLRRISKTSRAGEDVREAVPAHLDGQTLPNAGRDRHVDVARIGGHAINRPGLSPERSAHHSHSRPVVVNDLGHVLAGDILIARRRHLQ